MGPEPRDSAASRVADRLRERVLAGDLQPGQRLAEELVRAELGVARSTLREAFQLLIRERLLVHQLSRGVFVRELTRQDVSDLYEVRRVVECGALAEVESLRPEALRHLSRALADGHEAADREDWQAVAAASIHFHQALVGLAGSARLDALVAQVLGEFRLAYARMDDTEAFHEAFLARNVEIADRVRSGDLDGAQRLLQDYLRDSENALLARYEAD
ncbi:GntR family transcriptional regulator [Nocardioides sp. GXQ0305]|uniref:GntR family transcriptional regulator n=1 Tax=Nocardioides sp. GXQ0305 TaxID=3423912 RepID=UPI003D7DB1D4